ncbi:MAG: hypothetical protein IT223_05840 [Crocinitomicaceae bacterium]|nr:hypothetical protein [Crocinitomicaceae bacterium]
MQEALFLDNASSTGIQQMLYRNSVVKDGSGNIYTAGATINSNGDYDFLLTKHSSAGAFLWAAQYAGSYGGDDYAADVALDASGNPIVAGTKQVGATDYDAVVV